MKFLPEVKRGRVPLQAKAGGPGYGVNASAVGKPYKDDWDLDRVIKDALKKVIPVFRAVHVISDTQARLPFVVRQGAEDGPEIETHDLVRLMNQRPNEDETPYVFRYRLSSQVLLSRRGAFVEMVPSRGGGIAQLHLLDPRKTYPVPGESSLIQRYEQDLGGGKTRPIKKEAVIWVRLPHPVDPLGGLTPLEAAGLTVDIDVLAKLYNRTFLQNDGRPGGIVAIKGEMDDDEADELDERWNGSTRGAGRISIIEADGLDWVDTAISPRDAQYVEALGLTKVDILGAFGVPESLAYGNASGRTYDNAQAERSLLWEAAELGHLALLQDAFNQADGDDSTYSGFDLSGVEVLQRAEAEKRKEMRDEVKEGVRTLDSYLEATGVEALGTPESRSYWRPMGDVPYTTEGEAAPILSIVQDAANAAAKRAVEEMETKGRVVAPFRYRESGAD